ncbi:polysaccharide deacetylase family protein [Desulfobacterota bacterium M19]
MAAAKIKIVLSSLLRMSGWFALRSRLALKNKAAIFMYHRVLPQELVNETNIPIQPGMYVSPRSLRLHLSYLKNYFSLISLAELVRRLQTGEDISRCAVLTFDDGWRDNYLYAFPILQKFNVPATIFLTSGFIGTVQRFWPEEIGWAVLSVYRGIVDISLLPDPLSHMLKKRRSRKQDICENIDQIIADMKSWDTSRRLSVTQQCTQLRIKTIAESKRLLMNWDEVREMAKSGLIDFGSHTVSHALLDQLQPENVRQELIESTAQIRKESGIQTELFAYPNGNYTPQILATLPESGITAAVTTKRGLVAQNSLLLELPRIAVHDDISHTQALFQWRLFVK